MSGIVMRVTAEPPDFPRLKPLAALLETRPAVIPVHLELARWLAATYVEPLSNCVRLFAPPGQSIHSDVEYALADRSETLPKLSVSKAELIELLRLRGPLRAGQINAASASAIKRPIEQSARSGLGDQAAGLACAEHARQADQTRYAIRHPIDLEAISFGKTAETKQRRRSVITFLQQH